MGVRISIIKINNPTSSLQRRILYIYYTSLMSIMSWPNKSKGNEIPTNINMHSTKWTHTKNVNFFTHVKFKFSIINKRLNLISWISNCIGHKLESWATVHHPYSIRVSCKFINSNPLSPSSSRQNKYSILSSEYQFYLIDSIIYTKNIIKYRITRICAYIH